METMKHTGYVFVNLRIGWMSVDDVEFIGIDESPYGDCMVFSYEDNEYQSGVVYGSKPGE
jgi:hypothetical protein